MDDSDGKLDALVLFSFFTVTGIDRTDLQDGETQQKLSTAIAEAIGVSSECVKIDTITAITTDNLSVSIQYHVVVYTEDEKHRDDAHVRRARFLCSAAVLESSFVVRLFNSTVVLHHWQR